MVRIHTLIKILFQNEMKMLYKRNFTKYGYLITKRWLSLFGDHIHKQRINKQTFKYKH